MKFKKFFTELFELIEYDVSLDSYTVKKFLSLFNDMLSPKQYQDFRIVLKMLMEKNSKQLTIDEIVNQLTIKELEQNLKILKGVGN